jgi:hypothetical protein
MTVPALRVPVALDTQSFEKSIGDAKSLTRDATDFLVKQFAKTQLKLVANSDQFRPAVENAAKFAGAQFDKVKPQIQAFTQTAVKETTEAGLKVANVFASPAIKGSFQAFTAVGVPAVTGLAQAMAPLALRAFAAYEAFHLVSEAVGAARDQITAMVAVADKASNLTVSPQFLQLFEGEARKLKVTTDELDNALANAFNATKEKPPIDLAKWEVAGERITDVELALRVYNAELQRSTGKGLEGLVLFRDAQSQDDKVKAILKSMVELDQVGQHLQSLELGEKFFGAAFVDRIRQGKTSADGILASMEELKKSQDGIFSDALVNRAKAVDDQLKLSQDRLSRSLKPTWDDLASTILTIKGYWADVVDLIAQAVEATNNLNTASLRSELVEVQAARKNGTGLFGLPRIPGADAARAALGQPSIDQDLQRREEDLQRKIAALEGRVEGPNRPPPPSRGTGGAPTLKPTGEGRDPFETAVDNAEKRIATLKAEAASIDDTTAARERAKTVAQLEEAAKRANSAAGKANTEVTDEQRKSIEKEADAIQVATQAFAKAQVDSQIKFGAGTAFLSQSDVAIAQQLKGLYPDVATALGSAEAQALRFNEASRQIADTISSNLTTGLADVIDGTKTAGQAFQNFSKVVIRAIEEAIIKLLIVGPLMRSLQSGLGGIFGVGSIAGAVGPTSLGGAPLIGAFADGTNSAPGGLARINEQGGEIVNLPNGAQVIPHDVSMALARRGGGGGAFAPVYNIDARGSTMTESQFRAILADNNRHVLRQANASVPGIVAQSQLRAG